MMGDWSDNLEYEQREYYGRLYEPDREEETEEMTHDEMIDVLKEMAFTATETQRRALEDAISALSAEGDLISRQAVLDSLKEHRALYCDNTPETFSKLSYAEKSRVDELDTAIATIINLPSVENKGEWIIYGFPSSEQIKNCTEDYYCSECKFVVSRFESRACNYCPNCGAKMKGGE